MESSVFKAIEKKAARLSEIPVELYTGIEKFQLFAYDELITLLAKLTLVNGRFKKTQANFKLVDSILVELEKLFAPGKEYMQVVAEFAQEFDNQKGAADKYFKAVFEGFTPEKIDAKIMERSKEAATELLSGGTPKTQFLQGLKGELDKAISTNSSWRDTVRNLRTIALGRSDVGVNDRYVTPTDGKLLRYAKQIASDSISIGDRSYTYAVAQSLDAEWFLYFGDELPTSRAFCLERYGKYFHKKEIELWAHLDWQGKMKDSTNESTIFINCGGWNCQHSLLPVTIDQVPMDVIMRVIQAGMFEPSAFEREELGIPA